MPPEVRAGGSSAREAGSPFRLRGSRRPGRPSLDATAIGGDRMQTDTNLRSSLSLVVVLGILVTAQVAASEPGLVARAVAASGKDLEGLPFRVRASSSNEYYPAAAYGRGDFLVVDTCATSLINYDIRGRFVNTDGTVGSIVTIDSSSVYSTFADVAFSATDNRYMVVWAHFADGAQYDIFGKILDENGETVVDTFVVANTLAQELHPCVVDVWAGRFLVLWDTSGGDNYLASRIYGRSVTVDGAMQPVSQISPAGYSGSAHPRAAYMPLEDRALVVWQHAAGAVPGPVESWDWNIVARRAHWSGVPDGDVAAISETVVKPELYPDVAFSYITGKHLVVWQHRESSTDYDIKGSIVTVSHDGTEYTTSPSAPMAVYSTTAIKEANPRVAWSELTDQFLVAWTHPFGGNPNDLDVFAREVSPVGELGPVEFASNMGENNEKRPVVAAGDPVSLIVWEDNRTDGYSDTDLFARRHSNELPFRLRVAGITWSADCTTATVHYEASEPASRYYYRLYQTQPAYTGTSSTSATFTGLGEGYYLVVVTARDARGDFAPEPCRVWFYNKPVGSAFQVYIASFTIDGLNMQVQLSANRPVSNYYARLFSRETAYQRCSSSVLYMFLYDGLHYFVATGREAATGDFPSVPPGPARQFLYMDTLGF